MPDSFASCGPDPNDDPRHVHVAIVALASLEPRAEAQQAFVAEVDRKMQGTVWTSGGCQSWYLDANGRNSTLWPFTFMRLARRFDPSEFVCVSRQRHADVGRHALENPRPTEATSHV